MDTVLPGDAAVLPVNTPGLGGGELPCTVRLRDDAGHAADWSGTVDVATPAPVRTIHTGAGAYSTVPAGNPVPAWAIALLVMGALILAALVRILWLYRRPDRGRAG